MAQSTSGRSIAERIRRPLDSLDRLLLFSTAGLAFLAWGVTRLPFLAFALTTFALAGAMLGWSGKILWNSVLCHCDEPGDPNCRCSARRTERLKARIGPSEALRATQPPQVVSGHPVSITATYSRQSEAKLVAPVDRPTVKARLPRKAIR